MFKKQLIFEKAINLDYTSLNGLGVPQDKDLGMKHLINAAKNDSTVAKELLEQFNIKY
jgi:TPR repeat protein